MAQNIALIGVMYVFLHDSLTIWLRPFSLFTKYKQFLEEKPSNPNRPSGGNSNPNRSSSNNSSNRPSGPGGGGSFNRPSGGGPNRPSGPGGGPGGPRPSGPGGPNRPGGGPGGPRPSGPRPPMGPRGMNPRGQQAAPEHRINEFIRVPELRLVGDNMDELSQLIGQPIEAGIFPTSQLLRWAETAELDLVEISPNAIPPVARITDYNKFLYQKKKKEKEMKANAAKQQVKEIRFGPETGDHDFDFKLRHAKSFLTEGDKVKAYVQFRGRAIVFKDRGELLLLRFIKELEEVGAPEQMPRLDGKRMSVMIAPKKSAAKK